MCGGGGDQRERRLGVEKISLLVGNFQEYGEGYEEGGAEQGRVQNPDANSVRILQHMKHPEQRT